MASVDLFGENKRSVASWRGAGGGLPHRPPVDECIYHYVHAGWPAAEQDEKSFLCEGTTTRANSLAVYLFLVSYR